MKKLPSFAAHHPILFVLVALVAWLAVWIAFLVILSKALHVPFTEAAPMTLSRLLTVLCVVLLLGRLGWLKDAGVTRAGSAWIWLIAVAGIAYIAPASLYSFFGNAAFTTPSLLQQPGSASILLSNLVIAINEEIFFRGLVLLVLLRAWGNKKAGPIWSVLVTSLIFAVPHLVQAFSGALPYQALPFLLLQALVISFWWGALVVAGKSIWPAVLAHFIGNSVVTLQGLTTAVIEPVNLGYQRLLLLSFPLGVLGILLLARGSLRQKNCTRL